MKNRKQQWCLLFAVSLSLGACMRVTKKGEGLSRPSENQVEELHVIQAPELIVSETMVLDKDLVGEYSRVEFLKEGKLVTNGHAVNIKTAELIASGGEIETFPVDTKAAMDMPGRNGGSILIEAEVASGILPVTLRGEDGGDGSNGAPPDAALKGPQGPANTDAGESSYNTHDPFNPTCGRRASQPGNGGQGKQGYSGKSGGRGGSSGSLVVIVVQDQGLFLRLVTAPGIGGIKGIGGAGGVGGDPGPMTQAPGCMIAMTATAGPQGPQGKDGVDGQPGQKELSCIQLGANPKTCY